MKKSFIGEIKGSNWHHRCKGVALGKEYPFLVYSFFAILVVYVMMTHFDYNSNTNPPHMKLKITEKSISQMITQVQSSPPPAQKSQGMATLRPWYFKPKKTLYSDGDDLIIKKKKKFNSLHWTQQENYRYAQFLGKYLALVQGEVLEKRKFHLNRMMSKHIKTRSPVQCRSHHQKILKSFKTIEGIIEYFQNQPPAEISANSQAQESKGDANDEIISDQVQINSYIENNEEEVELENRENFLQSSFNRMFDIIRAPEDVFSERGVYSFPQLDSYQV